MGNGICSWELRDVVRPMFHFMIDLENTRSRGLQGAEYLCPEDYVTIFYSQSCLKVERGKLQQIVDAGSGLDICRLQKIGKNAMDFYIASRIGELFGSGYPGIVAIVSNDKGYNAVLDYWSSCVKPARKVILQPDIERCIGYSNEDSARKAGIQGNLQEVNLETQFGLYKERFRTRRELADCLADTGYQDLLGQIVNVVEAGKEHGRRELYLDTVKRFGKKKGLDIYTKIKQSI